MPDLETLTSPITLARFLTLGGCFKICKTTTQVLMAMMRNKDVWGREYTLSYDNCCVCLFIEWAV